MLHAPSFEIVANSDDVTGSGSFGCSASGSRKARLLSVCGIIVQLEATSVAKLSEKPEVSTANCGDKLIGCPVRSGVNVENAVTAFFGGIVHGIR